MVTIQIDLLLAKRFGMTYVDSDGQEKYPYIIHRTSLGCYERTLAYLLETYAGALPMWMAPVQVRVLPMGEGELAYAQELADKYAAAGMRVEVDRSNNTIGYKIRAAQQEKIPYMLVVGGKEVASGTVSVRSRKGEVTNDVSAEEFMLNALREIASKAR